MIGLRLLKRVGVQFLIETREFQNNNNKSYRDKI